MSSEAAWRPSRVDPAVLDRARSAAPGADLDEHAVVFDDLTALAARLLGAPAAVLSMADGERSCWASTSGAGAGLELERSSGEALCRVVVAADAPVLVGDARHDPRATGGGDAALSRVRAWAGLPVRDEAGRVLGALCVLDSVVRSWSDGDVGALAVLTRAAAAHLGLQHAVDSAGTARSDLDTAREHGRRAEQRLDRLARVTMELAGADSVARLTEVVINRAMPVLGVDGGAVLVRDHDRFRLMVSDRLGEHVQDLYGDLPLDSPLPACQVARTGERLVLANRAEGLAFSAEMPQVYEDTQRLSWVFAPLEVAGELLGALAVCWVEERDEVPVDELDLIDAFAAQCALAVERLRRTEEEQSLRREAEVLRERADVALRTQARVLELIAGGAAVPVVLTALAQWVEDMLEQVHCSVQLLEDGSGGAHDTGRHGGVLRVVASPGLPAAYRQVMDGVCVTASWSPCSVAVTTGDPVLVADLAADPRWTPALSTTTDLRSWWSFPVTSPATGVLLGTLALHGREPRLPDETTTALVARASHLVGITVDRHRLVDRLDHQARHDLLTGLPNRLQLLETLEGMLRQFAEGLGPPPVTVFLDLDRLKVINDSLGHETGDVLLVEVARRLRTVVSPLDTVARFGGDEFVVLSSQADVDVHALVTRILEVIAAPLVLEGRPVTPGASAGVLVASRGQTANEVLRDADIAMYRAKARGGGAYALFGHQMRQRAFDRLDLEAQLRLALLDDQLRLAYQPIVDLRRGDEVVGFEALVRWQHPTRGLLAPSAFLPLAEETGLVVAVGEWVLRAAVSAARRWTRLVPTEGLTMSVNLTAQQLAVVGLVDLVRDCARKIAPWSLGLELTESTLMDDTPGVAEVVGQLAGTGAELSIDDFGTGFSSLSYLTRLPIRRLKIDRSFVTDLERKPEATTVVTAILALADGLALTAVAEGVETAEQRTRLLEMGCRLGQGYLLGRPVPEDEAVQLLQGRRRG